MGSSTRPTDISAVGQESASDSLADNGLKQRRRTFGGKEKSLGGKEENKKGGGRRRWGEGRPSAGRGRNKKSARKSGEEETKRKLKKGKRQSTRKSYGAESRKGKLEKQGNHLNSTDALVSSVAKSILRRTIGGSLKKSEDWNENKVDRDQMRDLNYKPDRMLEDFPGCGSTQPNSANQQPWLGALFAVPLDPGNATDRFVGPPNPILPTNSH